MTVTIDISPERSRLGEFFGSGDSGDPTWATRDVHELRHEVAQRSTEVV